VSLCPARRAARQGLSPPACQRTGGLRRPAAPQSRRFAHLEQQRERERRERERGEGGERGREREGGREGGREGEREREREREGERERRISDKLVPQTTQPA
jgi:hypothetical protein